MKKIISFGILIMIACMLQGCVCEHQYKDATCLEPSKCELCGETQGVELGHEFSAATCTTPSTCRRCNAKTGILKDHKYKDATCTSPKKCTVCGITTGTTIDHKYKDATCTSPKECTTCGKTTGTSLGHKYKDATCTTAKKCSVCGVTSGKALGHNYNGATCSTCGMKNPRYEELRTILSEMKHDIKYISSYVESIDICISLLNTTSSGVKKQTYCENIRDDILDIEECLSRIRKECNGVEELKTLYDMCIIEVPEFSGTFSSYKIKANHYKVQADHVVTMYNIYCDTYK